MTQAGAPRRAAEAGANASGSAVDVAGRRFWDEQWRDGAPLPALWHVDSEHFRDTAERRLFREIQAQFDRHLGLREGRTLLEVGCARSDVLPLFATKSGFKVHGMDYSAAGCRMARAILAREHVSGEVVCADLFRPPERFLGRFDAVVSFGLVEHFKDTRQVVQALANLLRPGGVLFTHIPNMNGSIGWLQRRLNRKVYEVHVPLTPEDLQMAHEASGLQVVSCGYFLSNNFGVVNLGEEELSSLRWRTKRLLLTWLTRLTKLIWLAEHRVGELPMTKLFSPTINCVAVRSRPNSDDEIAPGA
jgi:2-polyprenyl-3-methyl-5-hydroxy-6-metoxy-1,4-benzoquinol methylase